MNNENSPINAQQEKQGSAKLVKWYQPTFLIATWFGSGKIPFAPGTMGSIFTLPFFALMHLLLIFTSNTNQFITIYTAITVFLYVIGQYSTHIYMQRTGKEDPKEVVIDEVVGQLIVSLGGFLLVEEIFQFSVFIYGYNPDIVLNLSELISIFTQSTTGISYVLATCITQIICLVLFRIFDIFKPFMIGWCDKNIKGAFGVMIDDVVAALFALATLFGLILAIAYVFAK